MANHTTRRSFINSAAAGTLWSGVQTTGAAPAVAQTTTKTGLAVLGGKPVRSVPFASWPKIGPNDEQAWTRVLQERNWCRLGGSHARRFEQNWARMLGARHCLATSSGTTALITCLNALDVGPGDEVIVPPYTFVATINAVLLQHALPVFVDTDRETSQIDANKIEAAITPRTRAILPVHLGGSPANLDKILAVGQKRNLPVLEDACQAHMAEWRGKKVSTLGALGCFSFQVTKNLSSGEGGAIITNDTHLFEVCSSFHNNGRGTTDHGQQYVRNGSNHRMTEFQGILLVEQLTRLEEQTKVREENASYLTSLLREIPGIQPARMYEGTTRNAYHLYMFRYAPEHFSGVPRARFLKALAAEGVPCSGGYTPLNKEPAIEATLNSRAFRKVFSESELASYRERNHCPENDRLCEEAIWFTQTMLLGPRSDIDQIAEAIRKIQRLSADLAKS